MDGNGTYGISNAVLRLINPNYQGYLTFSATNYTGNESAGFITFVVNRTSGSLGAISIQYATTNGTALNGVDYFGSTNTLSWSQWRCFAPHRQHPAHQHLHGRRQQIFCRVPAQPAAGVSRSLAHGD